MKKCYIMRGLPYSGKSTHARELAAEIGTIRSANELSLVNGVYRYCHGQVRRLHHENNISFNNDLEAGVPIVILDNCNIKAWEFQGAIETAMRFGYDIEIVTMPHHVGLKAFRETNWRNIPHDKFMWMYENFEDFELSLAVVQA